MSKVFEGFIEKLSEKSGYSYNFLIDRYNEMNDELGYVDMEEFYSITMDHVFYYYPIGDNNRFFKVKALVRKKDYDSLYCNYSLAMIVQHPLIPKDKIAAKSIIFIEELSVDEILKNRVPKDWTDEQKSLAIRIGIEGVKELINVEKLVSIGYSETFARYCFKNDFTDIALTLGSQEGLSMDMKVWAILNSNKK